MTNLNIAKKAAICYFGLSSALDGFPKGTTIKMHESPSTPSPPVGFLAELCEAMAQAWPESIGAMSKTARMSRRDFTYYVNTIRGERGASPLEPEADLIEHWMGCLADLNSHVFLVEIENNGGRQLLLVNTAITNK